MNSINHSRRGKLLVVRKNLPSERLSKRMDDSSSEEDISGSQGQANTGVSLPHMLRGISFDKPRNKVAFAINETNNSSESEDDEDDDINLRPIVEARFGHNQPVPSREKSEQKAKLDMSMYRLKGVLDLVLYQDKIRRERDAAKIQNLKEITYVDRSSSEEESETEQEVNKSDTEDSSFFASSSSEKEPNDSGSESERIKLTTS